jgi:hypothetical protein
MSDTLVASLENADRAVRSHCADPHTTSAENENRLHCSDLVVDLRGDRCEEGRMTCSRGANAQAPPIARIARKWAGRGTSAPPYRVVDGNLPTHIYVGACNPTNRKNVGNFA